MTDKRWILVWAGAMVAALLLVMCGGCATNRQALRTLARMDRLAKASTKTVESYRVPPELWSALVGLLGTIVFAIQYSVTHKKYGAVIRSVDRAKRSMKNKSGFNYILRTEQRAASHGVQRAIAKDVANMRKTL